MGVDAIAVVKLLQEKNNKISELEEENKKLREKIKYIRKLNTYDYNELQDLVIALEEENKKLREKLEQAHTAYRAVRKINKRLMNGYV